MEKIKGITLQLPLGLGAVNCYLVEADTGFVLIDTGAPNKRAELEDDLTDAGCRPGNLKLILLTHGDFDHTGNAAYLRDKFGTQIAMHRDDAGMAELGDMFWNRSSGNRLLGFLAPILYRFSKTNRFKPDLYVEEGTELAQHGFNARVVSIPGHSKGSVGILTAGGDLFCGDLLENTDDPAINSIMDDAAAADRSIQVLGALEIGTVYPGHGRPFLMSSFKERYAVGDKAED